MIAAFLFQCGLSQTGLLTASAQQQDQPETTRPGSGSAPQKAASEDCCTAEATARIAAAAGFIEVAGIKLGMPAPQVVAALQAHRPALVIQPPAIIRIDLLPGLDFVTGIGAGTQNSPAAGGAPGGTVEEIEVALTPPPSEAYAWGVSYQVKYPSGSLPTVEATQAALRKMYGPESGTTSSGRVATQLKLLWGVDSLDAYWVFDARGKPLPEKEAREFYRFCAPYAFGVKVTLSDNSFVKGRGEWVDPASRTNCGNNTVVTARWMPSGSSRGEPKGLVETLTVEGGNGLLHRSAYEATYAMELHTAGGKAR